MMNEIYKNLWNPLWNYFTPVMKLESKERIGGKIIKVHSKPKTPYQRLMDSGTLEVNQWNELKSKYDSMNPFELKKDLERQLKWFFKITEVGYKEAS